MADITDRAVLVGLSIRQWSASKHDKKITREVAQAHGSDESMGRYSKLLVSREALEKVKKLANEARTEHYRRTLPWDDNGLRIMASAGYFEYSQRMKELEAAWDDAALEFANNYPQWVEQARQSLNGLFDEADYPPASRILDRFEFAITVRQVPAAQDFRVDLGAVETARIRAEIEAANEETVKTAMRDTWGRLREVVSHMSERLRAYAPMTPDGVQNPFRDSLVTNINELLDVLPALNLTGDADLERFADDVRRDLTQYSAAELRRNDFVRADVAARADSILSHMEAYVS